MSLDSSISSNGLSSGSLSKWQLLTGVYVLVASVFLFFEQFWILGLPLVILLGVFAVYKLDYFYYSLFALVPISATIDDIGMGFGLSIPTEPLIFLLTAFLVIKFLKDQASLVRVMKHPISYLTLAYVVWMGFCVLFSEMPMVSLKFYISKLSYVICFYLLGVLVFRQFPFRNINRVLYLYLIPLIAVILYTLVRHTMNAYDEKAAHWVMQPFFKDHTIYGAILAFIAPFVAYVTLRKQKNFNGYLLAVVVLIIFSAGFVFSYTRAAWVSLAGAFGLYLLLLVRVKWYVFTAMVLVLGIVLSLNWEQLMLRLEKNKQDSSDDLVEHVQSISNIASDASNLERLNRWNSAIKMFKQKPVFGFGPGTYMFQYAPYQQSADLTIISTNFGDGGNAHSEYLGPLAEMGFLGMVFMIFFVAFVFYYGIVNYYYYDKDKRKLIMVVLLGFATYAAHGILNNYLDTDKASVLFWTTLAFLAAIDQGRKELMRVEGDSLKNS